MLYDPAYGEIPVADARELGEALAQSPTARNCTVLNWWRFAMGRSGTPEDGATITDLQQLFQQSDGNLLMLMQCLVMSPSFRSAKFGGIAK